MDLRIGGGGIERRGALLACLRIGAVGSVTIMGLG